MSNNLLKNKNGIIFGALDENSIAWKTAEKIKSQGGKFVLTNAPVALRMGKLNELAEKTNSLLISASLSLIAKTELLRSDRWRKKSRFDLFF